MLDDLKEQYFEEVRGLLPVHRLAVCGLATLMIFMVTDLSRQSFLQSLVNLPLEKLSAGDGGLFAKAEVRHLLYGLGLTLSAWWVNTAATQLLFVGVSRMIRAEERIQAALRLISPQLRNLDVDKLNYYASQSARERQRVRTLSRMGELCLGMALVFGVASIWGGQLDALAAAFTLLLAPIFTYRSVLAHFSKFLKYDLIHKAAVGDLTPSRELD